VGGRDVVVIGGSAGSIPALTQLVGALPEDLPAAIFVVVHVAPEAPGVLPEILARHTALDVDHARDGEVVRHGRVRVAPPDQHLLLDAGRVRLTRGPRENRFRPAIDPLFRSAAASYRERVVGVVLSGLLDDGTHGLITIKQLGGVAIVQDVDEAPFPSMPLSAMARVEVDHALPVAELGPLLARLASTGADAAGRDGKDTRRMAKRRRGAKPSQAADPPLTREESNQTDERTDGRPAAYACPSCGGSLWELEQDGLLRFRCRIGHGFTADGLITEQDERLEDALWTAVRALEEAAALRRRLAERVAARGMDVIARGYDESAEDADRRAASIRSLLERSTLRGTDVVAAEKSPAGRRDGSRGRNASRAPRRGSGAATRGR
jgi:two-component system chemotaxis response regulator CheB